MWRIAMTGSSPLEASCNERLEPVSALEALARSVCSQPAPGSLLAMISPIGRWETILGP